MSIILAKVLGIYFLAIGLSFLLAPNQFKNIYKRIVHDQNFLFLGAIIALLVGAVIVSLHNIWVWQWPLIITILGWWSLTKGFALLVYPRVINTFKFLENKSTLFYRLISSVYVVLGLFLLYKGWL